jgi:hypothetical protein
MNEKEIISKHFSKIAKLSHEKSPRTKEYYAQIQKKSVAKRKANQKLSKDTRNKINQFREDYFSKVIHTPAKK